MSLVLLEKFCGSSPIDIREAVMQALDEKAEMFLQERRKQLISEMFGKKFQLAEKVQRKAWTKETIRESLQEITVNEARKDALDEAGDKHWIKGAIKHPGVLHRELGVPEGEKIPASKLNKAAHAGGKEGERARLAKTLKGF